MLAMKRTGKRAGLFVAVAAVALLLSALAVGLSGYLGAASTAGTRAGLAALTGADGGFRITIPLASDASAQDHRVRSTISSVVRSGSTPVPVHVSRDVETLDPVELDPRTDAPVRVALASLPDLAHRARLVAGSWPTSADQVSMQADAALAFGVHPGELVTMPGGATVTITATWRVRDAADPSWLAGPIPLHGLSNDDTAGWVVIDPSLWPQAKAHPVARWTVLPDHARDVAAQLPALQSAPDAVSAALSADPRNGNAVDQDGLLRVAINPLAQNVQSALATSTAPLVVVAVLGLIMLVELARLLEQLRADENSLLAARGSSRARFVVVTAVEGVAVAVPGAALGALVALAVLASRGAAGDIPPLGWIAAASSALAAIIALSATAGRSTRSIGTGSGLAAVLRAGRLRTTIGVGAVVLLALAAIVAVSQFLLYGSPLAPDANGGLSVDPLAVTAPALAIAAVGVLAIAAFPLASIVLRRRAARLTALDWLPMLQLARRSRSAIAPVLVLAFAVSGLVVAAGYSGTWQVATTSTRAVQVGTPLRITPTGTLGTSITDRLPGQTDAAPALATDIQFGSNLVTLVEAPATHLSKIVVPVAGAVDPATLAKELAPRAHAAVVPPAATGILLDFSAAPLTALPDSVHLVVIDATGAESVIFAEPTAAGFAATLPAGRAPWTVHAVDLLMPDLMAGATLAVSARATGGSSASIPFDGTWKPSNESDGPPTLAGLSTGQAGLRALIDGGGIHVLLQSQPAGPSGVPVIVSRALARSSELSVGSSGSMSLIDGRGQLPFRVVGIAPAIPGTPTGEGVMADLGAVQDAALQGNLRPISADEWWVSTSSPERAVAALTRRAPPGTRVQTPAPTATEQVLESTRVAVWIAGVATALLALLAIAAGLLIELRARRSEVELMRVLGSTARVQARNRTLEWAGLLALGLAAGLIDGFLTAVLLVPGLARTAVPQSIAAIPTTFRLDPVGGSIALVALLVALVGLLLLVRVTVRGQALSSAVVAAAVSAEGAR